MEWPSVVADLDDQVNRLATEILDRKPLLKPDLLLSINSTPEQLSKLIIVDCCILTALDNIQSQALIDTGASINCLSSRLSKTLQNPKIKTYSYDLPKIVDVNGRTLAAGSRSTTVLWVALQDNKAHEMEFRIVDSSMHDVIVGAPWLKDVNAEIQCGPGLLIVPGDEDDTDDELELCTISLDGRGELEAFEELQEQLNTMGTAGADPTLPAEYSAFKDVFNPASAEKLPPDRGPLNHHINLMPGAKPPMGPIYSLSAGEREELSEYLDKNLAQGFIRRSESPCGSPITFAQKKDGTNRICVDYRQLNAITISNAYPIPLIRELFDTMAGAKIFTKLDLQSAYNLIRIQPGHEWATAFRTPRGLFEYLVMPFGLKNAPATFQSFVDRALKKCIDDGYAVVYLDDIAIYSRSAVDHGTHVKNVLEALRKAGLYAKLSKCKFSTPSMDFLGFVISDKGLDMDKERVKAITDWPVPTSLRALQAYLGFANFYRRFIPNFSAVLLPLTNLTKGTSKLPKKNAAKPGTLPWGAEEQLAFDKIKEAFTKAPLLVHYDQDLQVFLETDASQFAIAAIISQIPRGAPPDKQHRHPIAFYSRKLTETEQNYATGELEMLAIIEGTRHFRPYLGGNDQEVIVLTDHANLTYFMTSPTLNGRQARWLGELSRHNIRLVHRAGKANPADAPSRREDYNTGKIPPVNKYPALFEESQILSKELAWVENARQEVLRQQRQAAETIAFLSENHDALEVNVMATRSTTDQTPMAAPLSPLLQRIKSAMSLAQATSLCAENPALSISNGLVYYDNSKVFIPESCRLDVMKAVHDSPLSGHFGRETTLHKLRHWAYWPGMSTYVREYIRSCDACQRVKPPRHSPYGVLTSLPAPVEPWVHISMDFIVELPPSELPGKRYKDPFNAILVVVDRFSKMGYFLPTWTTITATELAHLFIDTIIKNHGAPESIVSDRGVLFTSAFWRTLAAQMRIETRLSTAYHPQTDGQTERLNSTLEQWLRTFVNYRQTDWAELLPIASFAYNSAPGSSTNKSPFEIVFGKLPRHPLIGEPRSSVEWPHAMKHLEKMKEIHEEVHSAIVDAQAMQAKYYDAKHTQRKYEVGNMVMLNAKNIRTDRPSKKLDYKLLGPYKITAKIGAQAYRLELPDSSRIHPVFHVALLEPFHQNKLAGREEAPPKPVGTITENRDEREWEVETVLDSRFINKKLFYKVRWKGFSKAHDDWQPAKNLANAAVLVEEFHQSHPSAPK